MDLTKNSGRLDFCQLVQGNAGCKDVSPNRTRQPKNIRLLEQQATRLVRDVMEQIMKTKVFKKVFQHEKMRAELECGKYESLDGYCGIADCLICEVDDRINQLDLELKNFCSMNRIFDTLDRAMGLVEECCKLAREEPSLVVTNQKWVPIIAKVMFETMRQSLDVYGLTGEMDTTKLQEILANLDYLYDNLDKKKVGQARFSFEVLHESPEESMVKILPIEDFFNDEEADERMISISVDFRTAFGIKQIPMRVIEWDGKAATADELMKQRQNRDSYLIRIPNGRDIGKQILSEAIFDRKKEIFYGSQPDGIHGNNLDPHHFLCPDAKAVGTRLILD